MLIAVQAARLIWILVAPIGPVGDWKAASAHAPRPATARARRLRSLLPPQAGGPGVVTSLNLKLYGVREDRATGRGSAIIALPDGRQLSFAVGEEIMPGVTLAAVGFDNVTISRGGAPEQIFLDQSQPRAGGRRRAAAATPPPPGSRRRPWRRGPLRRPGQAINLQPRMAGGGVNGVMVAPGSDGGQAFRAAGFAPGDVIVAVNGQRVTSLEQARAAMGQSGGAVTVMVERGGRGVPLQGEVEP